jgi:NAD(P)-dependent dehydrogenase (short-subunit alcohol dehydrogenase family)
MSKTAIITGAGSGIGRSTTLAFLKDGWNVVLAGRREEAMTETVAMSSKKSHALCVVTDVTDPASVKNLFAKAVAKFGRVDFVFNNAGIGAPAIPLEELTVEQWQNVVNTNLSGPFYCTQEAFRVMKAQSPQGGRIVNNGSISAYAPRPMSVAYTATKHAISGLTKTAMLDGRDFNIAVGQVDIGNAATEMAARMAKGVIQANGQIAVEPLMDVNHVGEAVLHMANLPLSSNIFSMTIKATNMPYEGRG